MEERFELEAIGWMRTPWKEKFGVPRQPGLVAEAVGEVEFAEKYAGPGAREGLEGFSHVWVTFVFDRVPCGSERLRVRPPRLGGNEKVGVFATRSPFRPNRLGLSVCEVVEVFPRLLVKGVDIVDGTPVVDIRPYLPYVEAVRGARGGFAEERPKRLVVRVSPGLEGQWEALAEKERALIEGMLALDPRPAYQEREEREYGVEVGDWNVRWRVSGGQVEVLALEKSIEE